MRLEERERVRKVRPVPPMSLCLKIEFCLGDTDRG